MKELPAILRTVIIKYSGVCPKCKRYLDDHDLLKGKPVCPK